jgi:NAD(P)-dependent dehydrogenase (short-subunit alcohol dehydrogenase family)
MTQRNVEKRLAGQKALVTDASSGIGRCIALALGKAGTDAVVAGAPCYAWRDALLQVSMQRVMLPPFQ